MITYFRMFYLRTPGLGGTPCGPAVPVGFPQPFLEYLAGAGPRQFPGELHRLRDLEPGDLAVQERDQDRAQGARREQRLQERGVVRAQVGDPVAAAHAKPAQAVRQPRDPVMQLSVGQPVIAMKDGDPVGGAAGAPRDPRAHAVIAHPGTLSPGDLAPTALVTHDLCS